MPHIDGGEKEANIWPILVESPVHPLATLLIMQTIEYISSLACGFSYLFYFNLIFGGILRIFGEYFENKH